MRAGSKPRLELSRDTTLFSFAIAERDPRNKEEASPRNVISFRLGQRGTCSPSPHNFLITTASTRNYKTNLE